MDRNTPNTHIKPTVEHMKCSLARKNNIIRKFILAEYGKSDYRIRYSSSDREYMDSTVLMVKVGKDKYEYIDF